MTVVAVGTAVTAGLGQAGLAKTLTSAFSGNMTATQVALGGMRSVATQGIGVVSGLQSSFDWKGVAASAISTGVAYGVGQTSLGKLDGIGRVTQGISAGVTSALVRGDSVNRNLAAIVTDSVAATIGNEVARQLAEPRDFYAALTQEMANAVPIAMESAVSVAGPVKNLGAQPPINVVAEAFDAWAPLVGGTAPGFAQTAAETLRFAGDQVLAAANYASLDTLAQYSPSVGEAAARNNALGAALLAAPGALARGALRLATGNISLDEVQQGGRATLALDGVEQLRSQGRIAEAQALLTQRTIGAASTLAGGAGFAVKGAGLATSAAQTVGMGVRVGVADFAASSVGQKVGAQLEALNNRLGGLAYVVPEGSLGKFALHSERISGSGFVEQQAGKIANATERTIAARNVWEARSILRDAGLSPAQRSEVIRSFDAQTFRVEQTAFETKAYRLFDDSNARLEGRYVSRDFFANQTDRIQQFALMGNSAARLGEVTIPQGSVIFTGRVAPQPNFSPGLTGGASQIFLTGPLGRYSFREILMPR